MRNKAGKGCSGSWCTGETRSEPEQAEEEEKEKEPLALSPRWPRGTVESAGKCFNS